MWLYFRMNFYVKTDSSIFFLHPHLSLCAACGAEMGTGDQALWIRQFLFRSRSSCERAAFFSACNFWGSLGNTVLFTRRLWCDSPVRCEECMQSWQIRCSWGDFASCPVILQKAATSTSLLLLPYSQLHFCWRHPLPEQMGLLCLAKLHPENHSSRAQCPLAAVKNKPQMYFDAAAEATGPSLKNTCSCQSTKWDGRVCVICCWAEDRGASFRIVLKWAMRDGSAERKIEVTLWKKLCSIGASYSAFCSGN